MIITSKPGSGNKEHIYIDGAYAFTLYDDFWYGTGYLQGQEISEEELAALKEEAGFRSAYEKALRLLGVRAYAEKELLKRLMQTFPESASRRAIEKVRSYGYLNDEEFAAEYARHLYENKKYDLRRIKTELKIKGISDEIVSNTLKTLDNEPVKRIIVMLRSKYDSGFISEKEERRFINKLMRMGYSFGDIKSAFSECGLEVHF